MIDCRESVLHEIFEKKSESVIEMCVEKWFQRCWYDIECNVKSWHIVIWHREFEYQVPPSDGTWRYSTKFGRKLQYLGILRLNRRFRIGVILPPSNTFYTSIQNPKFFQEETNAWLKPMEVGVIFAIAGCAWWLSTGSRAPKFICKTRSSPDFPQRFYSGSSNQQLPFLHLESFCESFNTSGASELFNQIHIYSSVEFKTW